MSLPRRDAARPDGARRGIGLVALGLAACMAVTGCTPSAGAGAKGGPEAPTTAEGLTVTGRWPLTGMPAKGDTPAHPVLAVKIDNSASSSPQIGMGSADLVTEELVEGGMTRLAVFFYQRIPQLVGPVRSMRATDIGIVKPAKAVLVSSGGARQTVRRVREAGIASYTEGTAGFERDPGRQMPYNLFLRLPELADDVQAKETVPSYLPFGSSMDLPRGQRATGLAATFSPSHTTSWTYARGRYTNLNSFAATGDRFRPDSVLVLRVAVGDAGYLDPAGNRVPETKFTGTGAAQLFHGGRVVRGTWKKSLSSPIDLRTADGKSLRVPAGRTWIELVPSNGGRVSITR